MPDDPLGPVQVLSQQGGRHHQSLAGVGKPLPGGSVDGKLAGRLQIHPQEVPQGVLILGVAQAAQHHPAGISRSGSRLGLQQPPSPFQDPKPLGGARLKR